MAKLFIIYLHRITYFLFLNWILVNVFIAGIQSDIIQVNSLHRTNCSEGLIASTDRIIFKGEILLDKLKDAKVIFFDIKSQGDSSSFITECFLQFPFCSDTGTKCNCTMLSNKLIYEVNLIANVEFSKGIFKAYFIDANSQPVSSEKEIPLIVDSSTIGKTVVNINNVTVNDSCPSEFDHGELTVKAVCNTSLKPCNLKLSSDEELKEGSSILYRREYNETTSIKLNIEQSICNAAISSTVFNCTIGLNKRKVTEQTDNILIVSLVGVIFVSLLIIAVCVCHRFGIFELCRLYVKQKALEKEVSQLNHLIEAKLREKNSAEDSKMFQTDLSPRLQKAKNDLESLKAKLDKLYTRVKCSCLKSILQNMEKKQQDMKKILYQLEDSLKTLTTTV